MPLHKDLTETDMHELKGASTATEFTVPISDGAGSTTFGLITADSLDPTSINLSTVYLTHRVEDAIGAVNDFLVVPFTGTCVAVYGAIQTAPSTSGAVIFDVYRRTGGVADVMCTLTWNTAVSNGEVKSDTSLVNSDFTAGDRVQFSNSSGTAVGGTPTVCFTLVFTLD